MARFKLLILFLFVFSVSRGQNYPDSNVDYLIRVGLWHLIVNDYPEAERHFNLLNKYFPRNPLGRLSLAIEEIAESSDKGVPFDYEKIDSLLDGAESMADSLLDNEKNSWNYFFIGAAEGLRTYYLYLSKNYISAFFDGLSAIDDLNNCLRLGSNFAAANVGIGTYKYWKSESLKSYEWLPFIKDESSEGVEQLLNGLRAGSYLESFGYESLIWIYLHEKKIDKAYEIAKTNLNKYLGSRFFLWGIAHAAKFSDKREAIKYFYEILDSYKKDSIDNKIRKIQILHKTALLLEALGRYGEALNNCNTVLGMNNLNEYELEMLDGRLTKVELLKEKLVKLIKNK